MASFQPVDFDPFAGEQQAISGGVQTIPGQNGAPTRVVMDMSTSAQPKLVPVDHDPFAGQQDGVVADVVKSLGGGLAKGVIGIAGLPGNIAEQGARGLDFATKYVGNKLGIDIPDRKPQEALLGSDQIQRAVEGVTGEFHKPQTTAGEYAQTIGEFAPAALLPGSLAARAGQVFAPALTSETAGQLTKGTQAEPWARAAGALAGGVGAGLLSRPGTAAQAIHGQMPPGVTPQMVDQADALIKQAGQQGIALTWPEALSQVAQRPVLTNVLRHLEASPQTEAKMGEFFGARPQQVGTAARGQFDQIAPPNIAPSGIGPAASEAAQSQIQSAKSQINRASEPYYQAAEGVLLTPQEMAHVKRIPGFQEARDAVRNSPQLNSYVAHLPDNSVGFLNEVKKQFDQAGKNAGSKFNPVRNQQVEAIHSKAADVVKQVNVAKSPDYEIAIEIQKQARKQYLDPLLQGPLGKLAKSPDTKKAIDTLFPTTPLANSEHEIALAVSAVAKKSPAAASDLVRAHVESVFNNSTKDLQTGANQAGGAKFRVQLMGNPQQRLNLRSAVEALPNGADRWQGFNKFMDVMEAIGTRQGIGSRTSYNEQFLKEVGKGGISGDIAKTGLNPARFGQKFIDRYEQWKVGKNLGQLANVLTDPGSAGLLRAIASAPSNSSKALAIASRLAVYHGATRRGRE